MFQFRPEAESPVASCDRGILDPEYTKDTTKQNGGRLERAPGCLKDRHGCVGREAGHEHPVYGIGFSAPSISPSLPSSDTFNA
jgi:hypothetical protein